MPRWPRPSVDETSSCCARYRGLVRRFPSIRRRRRGGRQESLRQMRRLPFGPAGQAPDGTLAVRRRRAAFGERRKVLLFRRDEKTRRDCDAATLSKYLTDPKAIVPGTK